MDDEVRLRHALMEMKARGLIAGDELKGLPRLALRIGRPIPLEYAPIAKTFGVSALAGALPFTAMLWPAFAADENIPGLVGLGMGLFAGLLFGICFAGYFKWQHRVMRLSRWQDLDSPPPDAPKDAKTLDQIEVMLARTVGRALR